MTNLIEYRHIDLYYQNQPVLKDICLNIPKNKTIAIVGQSGSGKSTLLKLTMQLLGKDAILQNGHILFDDQELLSLNSRSWQTIRGKQIGMIFQNASQYFDPRKKIKDQYIEVLYKHFKIDKDQALETAQKQLRQVSLTDPDSVLEKYPFELSGGMAQRVAIAMALSLKPKLLLADEPTSALDVVSQKQILEEFRLIKEKEEMTIMIVTHNMAVANYLADYIAVMNHGEIVEFGTHDQMMYAPQHPYTQLLLEVTRKAEPYHE